MRQRPAAHRSREAGSRLSGAAVRPGWRVARLRFAGHASCPLCWGSPRRRAPRVTAAKAVRPPSSSGLGHRPFKAAARVRIPLGALLTHPVSTHGPVEQLVSSPPCQGGGRGFKSRQDRSAESAGSQVRRAAQARSGSSVGMSVRLKSGRSAVRSRPWPLRICAAQRRFFALSANPSSPIRT